MENQMEKDMENDMETGVKGDYMYRGQCKAEPKALQTLRDTRGKP